MLLVENQEMQLRTSTKEAVTVKLFTSATWPVERELLITAINNRTRERNYANLCLQLAEGQITDEEFEQAILNNEDRYVISFPDDVPQEDVAIAAQLTTGILDVDTEDDFRELFSISSTSIHKCLEAK